MATSTQPPCPPKPPSLGVALKDEVIIVEAGAERQRYNVHSALLVHHSEYFAKARHGPWTEAHTRVITLRDIEPSTFNTFMHWLYSQQLPLGCDWDRWETITDSSFSCRVGQVSTILKAYVFGDRFLAPGFRRVANQAIGEGLGALDLFPEDVVDYLGWAFAEISPDRPVFQLLVNSFCEGWTHKLDPPDMAALEALPSSITRRMMLRYRELCNVSNKQRHLSDCYLEHSSDEEQKACNSYHVQYEEEHDYGYLVRESGD